MAALDKTVFLQFWPKCFIAFMAVIELIAVLVLFITELGNVAANFWTTNVFAGGWCGLVLLIHVIFLFSAGCCKAGPKSAFGAAVLAFAGLVASAALISFDAVFIARPTICVLTSSCTTNAVSNDTFTYNFRQSFFTQFNKWGPFTSYGESQVKFLCQTIQVGVGAFCVLLCIIYLIVYYVCSGKAKKVGPSPPPPQQSYYPPPPPQQGYYPPPPPQQGYYPPTPPQQGYYPPTPPQQSYYGPSPPGQQGYYGPPRPRPPPPAQPPYYQPTGPSWAPPPPVPQAQPGVIPWNANKRY